MSKSKQIKITTKNIPDKGTLIRYKSNASSIWKDAIFLSVEFVDGLGVIARLGTVETGANFFADLDSLRNPRRFDLRQTSTFRF